MSLVTPPQNTNTLKHTHKAKTLLHTLKVQQLQNYSNPTDIYTTADIQTTAHTVDKSIKIASNLTIDP